jgi:hypothetical protein
VGVEENRNSCLTVLDELLESLLIRYDYNEAAAEMRVTTSYWRKDPGASRAFIELRFDKAHGFVRIFGLDKEQNVYSRHYSTRDSPAAFVVQLAEAKPNKNGPLKATFSFGHGFGRIRFRFESLRYQVLQTVAREVDGTWKYWEMETNKPICFEDPFGRGWPQKDPPSP